MSQTAVADMRKRILEAAMVIAARSGFTQATTKEIAREAECSEGIIYHYFATKHDLFLALLSEKADEFLGQLWVRLTGERSAEENLERLIEFHFSYFTGQAHIFQVLFGKSGDATVPFPYVLKTIILPYQRIIEGLIKQGVESGEFRKVHPSVSAASLLGMMQVNTLKIHFAVKEATLEETKSTVKSMVLRALKK